MIDIDAHARPIVDVLETAGLLVGDGVAPKGDRDKVIAPCVIVHMLPGGTFDGGPDDPESNSDIRFQITSVGLTASQARLTAKAAADALRAGPFTVAGRVIQRVRPLGNPGVERDDDLPSPPLFYAAQQWAAWSFLA